MLLLDLNLHHFAWMLNNFRDEGDMPSTEFPHDSFNQIHDRAIDPELPEDSNPVTEWRRVRLDHAECAMDRPEDKEHNEQMVDAPEPLEICASRLL